MRPEPINRIRCATPSCDSLAASQKTQMVLHGQTLPPASRHAHSRRQMGPRRSHGLQCHGSRRSARRSAAGQRRRRSRRCARRVARSRRGPRLHRHRSGDRQGRARRGGTRPSRSGRSLGYLRRRRLAETCTRGPRLPLRRRALWASDPEPSRRRGGSRGRSTPRRTS